MMEMEKGLYVSRQEKFFMSYITTYALVMKSGADVPLRPATAHTLEHCLSAYLRGRRKDVVYVGVMGSMDGLNIIVNGKKGTEFIRDALREAFEWVTRTNSVPGIAEGEYKYLDLYDARKEAAAYVDVLR